MKNFFWFAIGWAKKEFGSYTIGLLIVAASLVCGAALVLCVPRAVDSASPA